MGLVTGLVLGIETSCDETAAAVVRDGEEILSNVVASQDARHAPWGGVVPEVASRAHAEVITHVIEEAMERAGVAPAELSGVAVTNRPGLMGSLLVGLTAAKALSWAWDLPLVTVHHLHAHLYAARWTDLSASASPTTTRLATESTEGTENTKANGSTFRCRSPSVTSVSSVAKPFVKQRDMTLSSKAGGIELPFVGLVCSGGHTSLYFCEDFVTVRRIGATTDDAAGEAFDKVAGVLGLGYPGGPAIERAASGVEPDIGPDKLTFPRARIKGRPWDFTFSGLKTAVLYHVRGMPPRPEAVIPESEFPRVAAAFQAAAVDMLVKPAVDAARKLGARSVTATGGVAANSLLREELARAAGKAGLSVAFPPRELCTDNAAMVAGRGSYDLARGVRDPLDVDANARPERARAKREKTKKSTAAAGGPGR